MKSPFPGMDPYLEARWSDVHATLIALIKEALQPNLPRGLRARSEERVLLEDDTGESLQTFRSDIALLDLGRFEQSRAAGVTTQVEPMIVEFDDGPVIDRYVQIIDNTNGNRLVTAIEVLSPGLGRY